MKILIALVLLITCEVAAQPITLQRGRLWGDSLVWQTPEEFTFAYAEDANLLFIPHAMRYILVYDLSSGVRTDTIDLVDVFGRDDVEIHEISCSRDGGVVAVAWNNTDMDSADVVVFGYPSLDIIREHVIGDSQPSFKQIEWGLYPITVSPKGTFLACPSTSISSVFLHNLTNFSSPMEVKASSFLPIGFDTAEIWVSTFSSLGSLIDRDTAQLQIIALINPDSIVRAIKVFNVGQTRSNATIGISADGTEVFYGGSGRRLDGSEVSPACGTWDVAKGALTRKANTTLYNWNVNRISPDGRWLVVNSGGGLNYTFTTVYDRHDSLPTYQIPSYARLISEDLTHFYRFIVRSPDSLIVYCDTLETQIPTSVNEPTVAELNDWTVFPNPTNDQLTIRFNDLSISNDDQFKWQMTDTRGSEVLRGTVRVIDQQSTISLPTSMPSGSYYFSVRNVKEILMTKRFVVRK